MHMDVYINASKPNTFCGLMLKDNFLDNAHANNILLPCLGGRFMTIACLQLLPRGAAEQTKKI